MERGLKKERMTFLFYDTEYGSYWFGTPTAAHSDSTSIFPDTSYITRGLVGIDSPTEKEIRIMQKILADVAYRKRQSKRWFSDEELSTFAIFGLIALFAAIPPLGLVIFLCIAFSGGKFSGFIGCLTPFLVLAAIAWLMMVFS